ncbi:hypothetical protein [Bacillus solimangrovi]|nr:hypothetical protein [Bacillus solimangrovi]
MKFEIAVVVSILLTVTLVSVIYYYDTVIEQMDKDEYIKDNEMFTVYVRNQINIKQSLESAMNSQEDRFQHISSAQDYNYTNLKLSKLMEIPAQTSSFHLLLNVHLVKLQDKIKNGEFSETDRLEINDLLAFFEEYLHSIDLPSEDDRHEIGDTLKKVEEDVLVPFLISEKNPLY